MRLITGFLSNSKTFYASSTSPWGNKSSRRCRFIGLVRRCLQRAFVCITLCCRLVGAQSHYSDTQGASLIQHCSRVLRLLFIWDGQWSAWNVSAKTQNSTTPEQVYVFSNLRDPNISISIDQEDLACYFFAACRSFCNCPLIASNSGSGSSGKPLAFRSSFD